MANKPEIILKMKKIIIAILVAVSSLACFAGKPQGGILRHWSIAAGVGTNGVNAEVSTTFTRWMQIRGGFAYIPDFKFSTDADVSYDVAGQNHTTDIDLDCNFGRKQTYVILNLYPFPWGSFYVAGGFYFGGEKLLKINGHSADLENLQNAGVEIGDYYLPVDQNGNVSGGLRIKKTRPYLGIGWGRAVPNNRVNFGIELGVQFLGKRELYTDHGDVLKSGLDADNDIQKIMDKVSVYPVLTFRLSGRIF